MLDEVDHALLDLLQTDSTLTVQELATKVGLSTNGCWRRLKQYEERGYILGRVALLNPEKLEAGTIIFVYVRAADHSMQWIEDFAEAVKSIPEVMEFYRMAGDIDYLLKLRVSGISEYNTFYKTLVSRVKVDDMSAAFAMEEIKNTTRLPLGQFFSRSAAAD